MGVGSEVFSPVSMGRKAIGIELKDSYYKQAILNMKEAEKRFKKTVKQENTILMQTKKQSVIESLTNIIVGLLTSFLIQLIIYPLLNIPVSINQNIIITIVFFIVSFIRGYLIRRYFNKKNVR